MTSLADQADPGIGIGLSSLRNELQMSQDSLRALADETGGFAAVNTNQFCGAFERIVADNSSYYLLAYYPPTDKKDGKFHRIEVKTKRPGLTIRARRGYVAAKPPKAPSKPPAKDAPSPEVAEALQSPLNVSGLTMNAFAAPFKGTAPNASVLIGVDIRGRDLALPPNGKVELSYLAVDAKGKTFGARNNSLTLNLKPETRDRVMKTGFRLLNRVDLPPGRYQMRVATHETGGNVGSVLFDFEVPDFHKLPFSMSGLLITSLSGSAMVTAKGDDQTREVLPAPPIAQRTFPQNDEIAVFAEIYDDGKAAPHKIDIITMIRNDVGTIFFKNEEERDSKELEGKRGGYGYTARIPLTGLQPGPYVLSVEGRSRLGEQRRGDPERPHQHRRVDAAAMTILMTILLAAVMQQGGAELPTTRQGRSEQHGRCAPGRCPHGGRVQHALASARTGSAATEGGSLAKEMIVGVFMGSRPTAGFAVEVVGSREEAGALVVQYRETRPARGLITAQVITSAYHIVAMPARTGTIRFERID